ncbi:hypothetical protein H0A61_02931 [Koleobacter methoxysyntrophicus]|uniref:Uncharacterized protein n=1 Tax=Koleobacter methoxysyntrophicus TaxID=2751313 RepID=A0A8A0RQI4_9FIRM|nr:hypothetical protein [Koleobacter methoxysyntrophicus]QSQ10523.1 hypothetical protein H0A61_02931 [Koleobacter methoxysyntrophicus]
MPQKFVEKIIEKLREAVSEAEKRAYARTISAELLNEIIETIKKHPAGGMIEADGGAVAKRYSYRAETTYVFAAWYWSPLRWKYKISADRRQAEEVRYGRGGGFYYKGRREAWKVLFEERYELLKKKLYKRRVKKAGLPMLDGLVEAGKVCGGILLAKTNRNVFLGTPDRWYRLPDTVSEAVLFRDIEKVNPWTVLWQLGFRKRKREWTPKLAKELTVFFVTGELTGWKL